ncbi:HAD family hydrolase [Rhodoplanes sp. Z2-YC6860]|uniref:HAD family hydrolase n=1 Tax=Rhodoplanes sp. Z2-YC6860 TaxID=674703 RepID=UPI00078CE8A8|nr:HAD family hydrolase [Rhodoplanes sp. Z2-YC6860]AMN41014.1 HAD-superfamily hydrolase [Rhodoplanes sp. Z2-YC6860]
MTAQRTPAGHIVAVVSDVDGTLLRTDKSLAPRTVEVVEELRRAGVKFAIVSSRPPRGMTAVIDRLGITTPIAGFNGGIVALPDLTVIASHLIEPDVARHAVDAIGAAGASAWVFSGRDWYVRDRNGPRVPFEQRTVGFGPVAVDDFAAVIGTAAKIVAVSDDPALLNKLQDEVRVSLSGCAHIARSQSYYLDFTHPLANKGHAVQEIAARLGVSPANVAVIGDGENDIDMFSKAGLSIAMGNGDADVQQAADFVTGRNDEDGAAAALEWFVLRGQRTPMVGGGAPRKVAQ